MTPHLHVTTGEGGRIGVYLPQRPAVAPTVTIRDHTNTALVTAAATTLESVSTTTTAAVLAGARSATLTAAGGVAGRDYEIGALEDDASTEPRETVRVLSRAAAVLTLARPVLYPHASGIAFYSTLATYDVAAAAITAAFRFGRAEFSWTDRQGLAQVSVVRLDALARQHEGHAQRRYPRVALSEQDLFDRYGRFDLLAPDGAGLRALMRQAELSVLAWAGRHVQGRAIVGADAIIDAAAWEALSQAWRQATLAEEGNPFAGPRDAALDDLLYVGVDTNQDGTPEMMIGPARKLEGSRL